MPPYVAAALICEKVIEDREGVLSLIRVVDQVVTRELPTSPQLSMVLSLRSEDAGEHFLYLRPSDPSGAPMQVLELPIAFDAENVEKPVTLLVYLNLEYTQGGLHWFDLVLGDQESGPVLTRIPLRVTHQPPPLVEEDHQ